MILSDQTILEKLEAGDLIIKPCDINDVQPCSVDLHLGPSLKNIHGYEYRLDSNDSYILEPQEFILASTKEYVEIPNDLVGIVDGKSSLGRLGIMVHVTAGYIDSGFHGNITLEIYNVSSEQFILKKDMSICQLILETLTTPCKRPYGSDGLNNHYQNSKGTIPSHYMED